MAITTTELGKVLITHQGIWVGGASYEKLDVVTTNGSSYLCILNAPAGITLDNTTYWRPLSLGAYDYAVSAGYAGTIEEFAADLADVSNKINISDIANNLTTTDEGKVLDARQGKVLNENKLDKSDVVNNLTTTDAGKALDARQGKALDDALDLKADKTYVDDADALKIDKTSIKQTSGTSQTDVVSQKFVTETTQDNEEVTAQSLVELRKEVGSLKALFSDMLLTYAKITTLDVTTYRKDGAPLFIISNVIPAVVPDFVGQIYIKNTATVGAWIATGDSAISNWKEI